MRTPPKMPAEFVARQNNMISTQVREYQLITPLFGGGVTPMECDPITVIRATEIRGHLRFWWRATRGGKSDGDMAKMKEEEDRIWGKAGKKDEQGPRFEDTVQIEVEIINKGNPVIPFKVEGRKSKPDFSCGVPAYAAFPLQATQKELQQGIDPKRKVQKDIAFKLKIIYPQTNCLEVEAALWAWETFGGIGARTRRGFGALRLQKIEGIDFQDLPPTDQEQAYTWLKDKLNHYIKQENYPEDVPHLTPSMEIRVTEIAQSPNAAWTTLITQLHNFRQYKGSSDKQKNSSLWPEANAIKKNIFKQSAFPRAAFGLPIIFHFTGQNAPADITLQGASKESERLTSPLILRPLACKNGRALGLALILKGLRLPPEGMLLQEKDSTSHKLATNQISKEEINALPMLKGEKDVLKAFIRNIGGNKL